MALRPSARGLGDLRLGQPPASEILVQVKESDLRTVPQVLLLLGVPAMPVDEPASVGLVHVVRSGGDLIDDVVQVAILAGAAQGEASHALPGIDVPECPHWFRSPKLMDHDVIWHETEGPPRTGTASYSFYVPIGYNCERN
jgi:hypothetical protein